MPARYTIDAQQGLIWSSFAGPLDDSGLLQHDERLRADPAFVPTFSHLVDFTDIGHVSVTPEGLRKLAQTPTFAPSAQHAIVAPQAVLFGLARMFQVFNTNLSANNYRIFNRVSDACEWLDVRRPDDMWPDRAANE